MMSPPPFRRIQKTRRRANANVQARRSCRGELYEGTVMTARALQLGTDTAQPNDSERRPLVIDKPSRSPARPRSSLVFYKACARAVDQETIVWDVGCGDGQGT